jgi:mannose-6-phosphate isomerase-like protein (cupin superfamily)
METRVRRPGEARSVPGHFAVVKVGSDETDERFCMLEATLADRGLTSRLHRHNSCAESWFVVDGALEFCSGNERIHAPAGSFVFVPPTAPHTFGNAGPGEARIVSFYAPGGMDRFIAELGKLRSMDDPGFGGRAFAKLFDRYDTGPADEAAPAEIPVRLVGPGEGEHLSVAGATITIKADTGDTGGLFTLLEYTAPPEFPGPPPHRHRETVELFYVLEGEPVIHVDGKDVVSPAGSFAMVAPGTAHKFSNPSGEPTRFLCFLSPSGFETYFRQLAQALDEGPLDPAVMSRLLADYDYEPA